MSHREKHRSRESARTIASTSALRDRESRMSTIGSSFREPSLGRAGDCRHTRPHRLGPEQDSESRAAGRRTRSEDATEPAVGVLGRSDPRLCSVSSHSMAVGSCNWKVEDKFRDGESSSQGPAAAVHSGRQRGGRGQPAVSAQLVLRARCTDLAHAGVCARASIEHVGRAVRRRDGGSLLRRHTTEQVRRLLPATERDDNSQRGTEVGRGAVRSLVWLLLDVQLFTVAPRSFSPSCSFGRSKLAPTQNGVDQAYGEAGRRSSRRLGDTRVCRRVDRGGPTPEHGEQRSQSNTTHASSTRWRRHAECCRGARLMLFAVSLTSFVCPARDHRLAAGADGQDEHPIREVAQAHAHGIRGRQSLASAQRGERRR
jgi:hypothetical protein